MKKTLSIVLIIFFVLLGVVAAACVWQWDNIKAVYIALNSTPEKINSLINENETKTNKILEKITDVKMRPLTDEERKQLETGELSEEDALKLIMGKDKEADLFDIYDDDIFDKSDKSNITKDKSNKNKSDSFKGKDDIILKKDSKVNKALQNKKENNNADASKGDNTYNKGTSASVDAIIAKIYLLRAEYLNALSNLEGEARSAASSIAPKDRTTSKKLELVERFTSKGASLEGQCDAKMEKLLTELKVALEKSGGDMSVISQIRSVYASEKQLKKSELFSKYNSYR